MSAAVEGEGVELPSEDPEGGSRDRKGRRGASKKVVGDEAGRRRGALRRLGGGVGVGRSLLRARWSFVGD